jgi:hypothetical protein
MNYLGHYAYNRAVLGLEPEPYFVLGVALPDLWTRFSRRRRLRWRAVRAAEPREPRVARLRAGLLNHVAADRRFHALPIFEQWRKELRQAAGGESSRDSLTDFLTHLIPELTLDRAIACRRPELAEAFYDALGGCDREFVEAETGRLGEVDAAGLACEIDAFVRRRFLPRFRRPETIFAVVDFILGLTGIAERPSQALLARLVRAAEELVRPEFVWAQMGTLESAAAPARAAAAPR